MDLKKLTRKQSIVLEAIEYYEKENGRPPTYKEIAKMMNMKHYESAIQIVDRIEEKGYIKVTRNTARGIQVIKHD